MAAALILIVGMLALGQLFGRARWLPDNAAEVLQRFVLLICLPALVIVQLQALRFDSDLLLLALLPWVWLGVSVVLISLASRIFGFSAEVRTCLLLTVPLGNTAFLGYPMIEALAGHAALRSAVVYDQLGSFLILSLYAVTVAAAFRDGKPPAVRELLLRIVVFPAFIAMVLGLLPIPWPTAVLEVLKRLADCLVPLVIFAIGLKLRFRLPSGQRRALVFALVLKLGVGAVLAWSLCLVFGMPQALTQVAVLQAAMPVMVTAAALAIDANAAPELAAAQVGIGVLLALLWLPLLNRWLA